MNGIRKYIWLPTETDDSYAEFQDTFAWEKGNVTLEITADYQFAAYVNGRFAANSQFADLPDYKVVTRYDITGLCRPGENVLTVKASHPAADYFQSCKMTACVSYAVTSGEKNLATSSEKTRCRPDTAYGVGDLLTPQLGMGYTYDFTAAPAPWGPVRVVAPGFTEAEKTIANTFLVDMPARPALIGEFRWNGGDTAGEKMQRAWQFPTDSMADRFPVTTQAHTGDGLYLLCDMGGETAGYPYFNVECAEEATAHLGWGEHLTDGRLRTSISIRNFAVTIRLKPGRNDFSDYLRRIGCRYLCLYIQSKAPVTLHAAGVLEERYPFRPQEKDFGDRLLNRLYTTGRRTLELCAHQHYEDCPWREQALYGMDSRNQMLFGYGVFNEYRFPRANLLLMAKCLGEDGLLHICPPSRSSITIPSFSAYWVLACGEYVQANSDDTFVAEVLPAIERVMAVFMNQTWDGVVHTLGPKRYWNFHEWSQGLDEGGPHRPDDIAPYPDAPLSAICCRAAEAAAQLATGEAKAHYQAYADTLAAGFHRFYVPKKGLYASYIRNGQPEGFHELTQALLLSTGKLAGLQKESVIRALQDCNGLVPITLSGMALKYEGLLKYANARDFVLEDMIRRFAPMAQSGSTYWETALGQRDFENAGSLCHGWSAVPCYVLDQLFGGAHAETP